MLVLTRKPGERIFIGDDIVVTLISIRSDDDYGPKIRIGLDAPSDVVIRREEVPDLRKAGRLFPAEVNSDALEAETRQLRQKVEAIGCQTARETEHGALDARQAAGLCEALVSLRRKCNQLLDQLGRVVEHDE
jgi:carbon storage regulator